MGRAAAALFTDSRVAPSGAATLAKLQQLFPAHAVPEDPAEAEAEAELAEALRLFVPERRVQLTDEALQRALLTMPRHSAGGCSKVSADLLCDLAVDSPSLRKALLPLAQQLVDDALPESIKPLMRACRLVGLRKPARPDGVRPIGMGEWLRRLTARALLHMHVGAIQAKLAPVQLGVGVRNGCETSVKSLQAVLDANPGKVVVTLDFTEAFNRLLRQRLWQRLLSPDNADLHGCIPFLRMCYGEPSNMWYSMGEDEDPVAIQCEEGVQQGCVWGPALFCLGIQPELEALRAATDYASATADDVHFVCEPAEAADSLRDFRESVAGLGASLNLSKCKALSLEGEVPQELRDMGLQCVDVHTPEEQRGVVLLGAPVGTAAFCRAVVGEKLEVARCKLARLRKYLSGEPQCAFALLRCCVLPSFTYLLRCLPPCITGEAAAAFDLDVLGAVGALVGQDLPLAEDHPAVLKLRLRISDGGLGLTSQAALAPSAYVASVLDARGLLAQLHPDAASAFPTAPADLAALEASGGGSATTTRWVAAIRGLPPEDQARLEELAAAPAADALRAVHHRHTQRTLTRSLHTGNLASFRESLQAFGNPSWQATFLSQRGYLGTAWLLAYGRGSWAMDSTTFRLALADYLLLPQPMLAGASCSHCHLALCAEEGTAHMENCATSTTRHNDFTRLGFDTVYRSLPGAGAIRSVGLTDLYLLQPNRRPDRLYGALPFPEPYNRPLVVDTTVVSQRADFRVAACAAAEGHAAAGAHATKQAGVLEGGLDTGRYQFLALAVETGGHLHESVVALLGDWATHAAALHLRNGTRGGGLRGGLAQLRAQLLEGWRRTLSVALVKASVGHLLRELQRSLEPDAPPGGGGGGGGDEDPQLRLHLPSSLRALGLLGVREGGAWEVDGAEDGYGGPGGDGGDGGLGSGGDVAGPADAGDG